jgi:hypothetical protein
VDVLVVHYYVTNLRHTRKKTRIGIEPRVKQQRGLYAEKFRKSCFECGVCRCDYEKPGAPRAKDFRGGGEFGHKEIAEIRQVGKGEVVVRCKIQ